MRQLDAPVRRTRPPGVAPEFYDWGAFTAFSRKNLVPVPHFAILKDC